MTDMEQFRQCITDVVEEFFADSPVPTAARAVLVNELIHELTIEAAKQHGSVRHTITGTVHGTVIQAGDIDGGVRL